MITTEHPLVEALYGVEGKAEIVDGKIVYLPMTGSRPGFAGDQIFGSLWLHTRQTKTGLAIGDGKGFLVELPHRQSLSPDVAYNVEAATSMKFFDGAPQFAVEVRSESDYGVVAEREMAAKRADYFAAGTLVVWDVDLLSDGVVRVYRASNPEHPSALHRRGEIADAEPAVPGWTMPVDDLFAPGT